MAQVLIRARESEVGRKPARAVPVGGQGFLTSYSQILQITAVPNIPAYHTC